MEIREIITDNELSAALSLFQNEFGNEMYKNFGIDRYKHFVETNNKSDEYVIRGINNNTYKGYIALDRGVLVGMAIYMLPNYIRKIAVRTGYRDNGIGSALLEMIEDDIKSKEIVVHALMSSVDFYLKNGYEKIGELNGETYPYYPMKKEFC